MGIPMGDLWPVLAPDRFILRLPKRQLVVVITVDYRGLSSIVGAKSELEIHSIIRKSFTMKTTIKLLTGFVLLGVIGLAGTGCGKKDKPAPPSLVDDGGGRKPADFP